MMDEWADGRTDMGRQHATSCSKLNMSSVNCQWLMNVVVHSACYRYNPRHYSKLAGACSCAAAARPVTGSERVRMMGRRCSCYDTPHYSGGARY